MILGLKRGEVWLVPHQAQWSAAFAAEKQRLAALLGETALHIEHVGSTAVPALPAKPVIDVAVAVRSFAAIVSWPALLAPAGYAYFGDREGREDHFFAKGPDERRTFYLHVVPGDGERWQMYLRFRDALRASAPLRAEYATLKQQAAGLHANDRTAYGVAKDAWFSRLPPR